MGDILNRMIIFTGLTGILFLKYSPNHGIIAMAVAIAISGLLEYFNNEKLSKVLFIGYLILALLYPQFVFYLPLLGYDLIKTNNQLLIFLSIIPYALHSNELNLMTVGVLIIISVIVSLLKIRAMEEGKLRKDFINQRDYLTELSMSLEEKIDELVIKQDIEVNLATLNERNRIAREIHDNVGHLLSSSILQIGAIMAISKEEGTIKSLELVKNTLNEGMNSIRNSIHDLHDNSIDLYDEVNKIIKNFTFCKVKLTYEITGEMTVKAKYAVIAIIKEALSNVIKHSDCERVFISLYEHPKLFQLIIYDNGSKKIDLENVKGMGLESIKQRVASLKGNINFDQTNGFKIFISFMKT